MKFSEIVKHAVALLQDSGRVSYRALEREFGLDDETLEDLKEELLFTYSEVQEADGRGLVWTEGDPLKASASAATTPSVSAPPNTQAEPAAPNPAAPEGERRQLTVMFCDLVGSTALSEQLDPEDLHAIVRTYQDACRQVIERYEGHIAQYLGDGILVYFGYPAAHEDDAIRAVKAGLDILAALPTLELAQPIQVRVGIHTGPVVIGAVGGGEHTEQLALGETPNIAARVQGMAAPNTLVISTDTYHLVQGFFVCGDLGPQDLKGLSSPLTLYNVTGEGEARNRFDVSMQQGLTPLVGREEEVELLLRRWERAKAGQGQVVLLNGEAGIGKSRLVQVLRDHSRNEPHLSILCRCSPFYQNSALYPVIDRMQQVLHFNKDDSAETKLTKLTQSLEPVDMHDEETVALFAALLSIPLPDDHPPLQYSPQKQKEKTLQALVTWLHKAAAQQPVRLEFEDLHWADPSTLELLGLLTDEVRSSQMLLLLTFRPEFTPPWPAQAHTLQMYLNRLPQQDIAAMVERVAGKGLPDEVVQQLLTKSDGVPLYIEEMTKNLVESGLLTERDGRYELTGPLPDMAIPSSLQDSFAARLDRLAPVRELAQVGAVLGRDFSYELIQAVSQMQDPKLQDGLGRLSAAEILFQRGVPPDATYTFKHALLQDVAYQSLLKSQRQQFHAQTAQVLEQQFSETKETHPELLAHHFAEASLAEQAIPYWQQAGQRATQRSAYAEAINHLTQGLAVLQTLPDTLERAQHELMFQIALAAPLFSTKGWAAPELGTAYTRAYELCQQLDDTPQLFSVLFGMHVFYVIRAELTTAQEHGEQLMSLAQHVQDPERLLAANFVLGHLAMYRGEFASARAYFEQNIALYDSQQHQHLAFLYGQDMGVTSLFFSAHTLWLQGYPDQALTTVSDLLALAQEVRHPFSRGLALMHRCFTHMYRRETAALQESLQDFLPFASERGFPVLTVLGTILQGWGRTVHGADRDAMALLRESYDTLLVMGLELNRPQMLALLAEGYETIGQPAEGLRAVAEALALSDQTGERWYEAELYRLKGELTLQESKVESHRSQVEEEAEVFFQQAMEIARRQQAKSWELRAATSLARLWQKQGKTIEARDLLVPVYDWFTEGFDTADLKDAKALLDELA